MRRNLFLIFAILIIFSNFASASYAVSEKFIDPRTGSFMGTYTQELEIDSGMCESGQDFIIQIAPGGCSPPVVRSDLLEEQNTPVFCKLQALKINPAVRIIAIDDVTFGAAEYPKDVSTIAFLPTYSALGLDRQLTNTGWNDIGYAVIYLKRNVNESSMPEFVSGTLKARIRYSAIDAFGSVGRTMYLPLMSDAEFDERQGQYSFFNNMGYLRADEIGDDYATISIYSGVYDRSFGNIGSVEKQKILSRSLDRGEKSSPFFLPGFGCFASSYLRLDGIEGADTRASLKINSEVFEVKRGETFLDGKCTVTDDPDKEGLRQIVKISCVGDERRESFILRVEPTINLSINGITKEYKAGEWLYINEDGDKNVYLGYVGTKPNKNNLENAIIYLVTVPGPKLARLDDGTLKSVARVAENHLREDRSISDIAKSIFGVFASGFDWLFDGNNYDWVEYKIPKEDVFGSKVEIISFGVGANMKFGNQTLDGYYGSAINDYQKIKDNFASEVYPEGSKLLLGEYALKEAIDLSSDLQQREDLKKYCDLFKSFYSDSKIEVAPCEGIPEYFNDGVSSKTILIGGDYKQISFQHIQVPSVEEYGIEITIKKGNQILTNQPMKMQKGDILYLDSLLPQGKNLNYTEFIKLVEINDEESARLQLRLENRSIPSSTGVFLTSENERLELNSPHNAEGTKYVFTVTKINLKKVAKVSVHTAIKESSEVDFNFNIGIEKRIIKLSPDQIKSQIETTKKLTEKLESISNSLGKFVDTMRTVCLGTGATLTLKNLIFNSGIESLARTSVMNGEKGWYAQCSDWVRQGLYSSKEQCLLDKSETIENQIEQIGEIMALQNENFEQLENLPDVTKEGGFLGQDVINQTKLMENYLPQISGSLPLEVINPDDGEIIDLTKSKNTLNVNRFKDGVYSLEDAKEIELYSKLVNQYPEDVIYQKRLYTALYSLQVNSEKFTKINDAATGDNLNINEITVLSVGKNVKDSPYSRKTAGDFSSKNFAAQLNPTTPVQKIITTQGDVYYAVLEEKVQGQLNILKDSSGFIIYDESGSLRVPQENLPKEISQIYFKRYDSTSYNTPIKDPKVKYYETEPYKGLPAVVPFDVNKGWYAYIPQTLSITQTRSYDDSARINSFWICNAGVNGIMEYNPFGQDEICQLINLGIGQPYNQFPGLEESEATNLVRKANNAILKVSRAYRNGVSEVDVNGDGKLVLVGSPALDLPTTQCTDVMSSTDCQILFNVCDPVICPSSRCDFGGDYPVRDVVQSGLIGSVVLCLPNWNEGIYIPVCLTGVKAGLDNLISVTKSYQSCLETSLEKGQTIGICDEIYSIYGCELIWRTALPLVKLTIPTLDNWIFGGGARGGGEYLGGIQGALENAQSSMDFFTQNYAISSYDAFKARSQEEVGTAVCKNFVSIAFPQYAGTLNILAESSSPPQFTANFEAIPFSSVTNPPQAQYKVFFHIFAGNDIGASYQVYLKTDGSSFYRDISPIRAVASGYIPVGGYETKTPDFTAPEGYKELCVRVNNQEECGFGSVTTDFALDYLKEKYLQSEANTTDIKTQEECISGGPNLYNLLGLNVQEGVSDLIDPSVYNDGIIRICATGNPGSKSDGSVQTSNQRWVEVGYCGDQNVKCWIDKDSIAKSMNTEWVTYDNTLESLTATLIENLKNQKGMLNENDFDTILHNITNEKSPIIRIGLIESIYNKVFENNKKGYLLLLEGRAYGELARGLYNLIKPDDEKSKQEENKDGTISPYPWQSDSYISNIYHYIENNPDGVNYDYCYKFEKKIWYRAQKSEDKCGEFSEASGSVVNGKDFVGGLSILLNRVKDNSDQRSLSAGRFNVGKNFYFKPNKDLSLFLGFSIAYNTWMIDYGGDNGFEIINPEDGRFGIMTVNGFNYGEIFINLTDKNLYYGAVVLFEGKGFVSSEKNIPIVNSKLLTEEEMKQLNSMKHFSINTHVSSIYKYDFAYADSYGWMVKNTETSSTSSEGEILQNSETSQWIKIDDSNYETNKEYLEVKNLLDSLKNKDYLSGVKRIIEASIGELGPSGRWSYLKYNETTIDPEKNIKISNLPEVDEIYFYYKDNKWMYSYDESALYYVEDIRSKNGKTWIFFNKEYFLTDSQKNLLLSLKGLSEIDGMTRIFLYGQKTTPSIALKGCSTYYEDIKQISKEKEVDPYLVLAIMYQESLYKGIRCNPLADSGSSYGLMQINTGYWCLEKFGLPTNKKDCKQVLLNNPQKNIEVGVQILYDEYQKGSVIFNGCNVKNKQYSGWEAALRRYNGLGCNENFPSQDQYVENVVKLWNDFKSQNVFESQSSPPTTPPTTPEVPVITSTAMEDKILEIAKSYIGKDTFRITQNGKDYSYVCSTFTSKVLSEAGAFPNVENCDATLNTELQNNKNLHTKIYPNNEFEEIASSEWRNGLKAGDLIIWGCKPAGEDCNPDFQHSTIFEKYDLIKKKYVVIGDPGSTEKIRYQNYTIGSSNWYITHVWRSKLDLDPKKKLFEEAISKVKILNGKYIDNFQFVDKLYADELITKGQYDNIKGAKGVWALFNAEEDMEFVLEVLEKNYIKEGYDLSKLQNSNNRVYISYLESEDYEKAFEMVQNNNSLINLTLGSKESLLMLMFYVNCDEDKISKIKYLISHGADVNIKNSDGYTSLMLSSDNCEVDEAKLLLSYGAKINEKDNDGWTPLTYAVGSANSGRYDIVKYLLDNGADINVKTNEGNSLLYILDINDQTALVSEKNQIRTLLNSKGLN